MAPYIMTLQRKKTRLFGLLGQWITLPKAVDVITSHRREELDTALSRLLQISGLPNTTSVTHGEYRMCVRAKNKQTRWATTVSLQRKNGRRWEDAQVLDQYDQNQVDVVISSLITAFGLVTQDVDGVHWRIKIQLPRRRPYYVSGWQRVSRAISR